MCMACAAGAMTTVAGATGARLWVQSRFPHLGGPRARKIVRRSITGAGVLAAGLLGPSAHGPVDAPAAGRAAAPAAAVQPALDGRDRRTASRAPAAVATTR